MRKLIVATAAGALAAAAFAFSAQAYCRGCAMNAVGTAAVAPLIAQGAQEAAQMTNPPGVDAVPMPDISANHHDTAENAMNSAVCHTERKPKVVDGKRSWSTEEICE